jgi:hypothetical protein
LDRYGVEEIMLTCLMRQKVWYFVEGFATERVHTVVDDGQQVLLGFGCSQQSSGVKRVEESGREWKRVDESGREWKRVEESERE